MPDSAPGRMALGPAAVLAVLLATLLAGCGGDPVVKTGRYPSHPRLILTGDLLDEVRQQCAEPRRELYLRLREGVDRRLAEGDSLPPRDRGRLAESCAFLYLAGREEKYLEPGLRLLKSSLERYLELERTEGGGYWEAVEFRRYCAFAYDWLHPGMSPEQRRLLGARIIAAGRIAQGASTDLERGFGFSPYNGGGYGSLDPLFWPAAAMAESGVEDSLAAVWLQAVERNINLWRRMQDQVAADDGGMYSGMAYAAYNYLRTPIFDLEIWKNLTGEDLTEDNNYLRCFPLWWLWVRRPNGEYLRMDDAGSVRGAIAPWHFKYLARRYRDPLALWCLERLEGSDQPPAVWDLIWDTEGLELTPAGPDSTWPAARHFEGTGWVVMRSGWDSTATQAVFDCGDFYYGHQHPVENSFVIFRRGSLAINSGRYEWGSDHRPNYMGRTISSNNILVRDPQERFLGEDGEPLSNDGGQRWPLPWRQELGQSRGTEYDTGEIIAFETDRLFSYVCGDAARAYSPHKLTHYTRQFLHLLPELFLVFDRVESADPKFSKHWVLHAMKEPALSGRTARISERQGVLLAATVFPKDARVRKVGGPGREFWVFGKNYPPSMTHYRYSEGEEWGAWRLEVTPGRPRTADSFLHVLLAGGRALRKLPALEPFESAEAQGVVFAYGGNRWRVSFNTRGIPGGWIEVTGDDGAVLLDRPLAQEVQPQSGIGN